MSYFASLPTALPSRLAAFLLPLAVSGVNTGCADEIGPGSIVVPVELGNQKSCEEVGVTHILAELDGGMWSEEVTCDLGEVRFDNLEAGEYELWVGALDSNGVAIMDNSGPQVVEVVGDGTTVTTDAVRLTDAPAKVRVRWDFGFGSCSAASIDRFEISAFEVGGSADLLSASIACSADGDSNGYRELPDPNRDLRGNLLGEIAVTPVDSGGTPVGSTAQFTFEPPGPGYAVNLSLSCEDTGCTSSGVPD